MRTFRFDRWQFALLSVGVMVTLLVLGSSFGASRAHAQQAGLGAPIMINYECADVSLTVQASDADFTSIFWRSGSSLGLSSKATPGTTIQLNGVTAGELVLGIYVEDTGYTFWSGAASNNAGTDGLVHAEYNLTSVGFEDIYGGGDFDYNDAVISISITPCEVEPELVVLTLSIDPFGTGFGIVSGEGIYTQGSTAHPVASAAGGSYLVSWGGACAGSATSADVLMDTNKHCTVRFDSVVTPTPPPTATPTATPTPEVEGAEVGINNTRVSSSPAPVGDGVTFRIDVTLTGVPDVNEAQVLVEFDSSYLSYQSASVAQCQLIGIGIACDFGQISTDFSFDVHFTALQVTNLTATDATLGSDFDGPGAGGSTVAGPASAEVAIVDIAGVQLPPLGDGSSAFAGTSGGSLPLTAGIVLLGAVLGLGVESLRRSVVGR